MSLKFGLDELATEGEHAARIVAVKELGIVKGQFRSEEKVKITFEMLDQPDANGDYASVGMTYAAKVTKGSHLGRLLDDMGWTRDGKTFDLQWLVGETMHVNIQHNKDGRFANVTHVIKDPAIVRAPKGVTSNKCDGNGGKCPNLCYGERFCWKHNSIAAECLICEHDDCTNNSTPGSKFCYRHGGEI
jgi:hypothetical protein